jgi:type IV pilus assembly protein PilF
MAAYNLAALQYQRGAWPEAQSSIRTLNNGEYANAESMWLGIRIARKAGDGRTMRDLTEQMRRRFASSPQYRLLERGAFDE